MLNSRKVEDRLLDGYFPGERCKFDLEFPHRLPEFVDVDVPQHFEGSRRAREFRRRGEGKIIHEIDGRLREIDIRPRVEPQDIERFER